jgi:uncharacterized protein (TIGR00369 family)
MEAKTEVERRIARLAARDRLMRHLGVECVGGGPGRAAVSLAIRDDHLNFNGTCHGGAIFALADSAFGLASNSQGVIAAAIDAHITYQVAVKPGDASWASTGSTSRDRTARSSRASQARSTSPSGRTRAPTHLARAESAGALGADSSRRKTPPQRGFRNVRRELGSGGASSPSRGGETYDGQADEGERSRLRHLGGTFGHPGQGRRAEAHLE